MKPTFISLLLILSFIFTSLSPIHAQTTTKAQLIESLLAQIAVLQAELNKLRGVTTTSTCTFTRLLYFGVKGTDVTCLQNYLKSQGYFTEIPNGNYGPYTMDAASRWQKAQGIIAEPKEYGLWGEQSRAVYTRKLMTPVVAIVDRDKEVEEIDPEPVTEALPEIIATFPRGEVYGTTTVELSVTTEGPTSCKYGTSSMTYALLPKTLNGNETRFHKTMVSGLVQNSAYSYYARCVNKLGVESKAKRIRFTLIKEVPQEAVATQTPPLYNGAEIPNNRPFVVFDNVAYKDKPNTSVHGVKPIKILYATLFGVGTGYEEPDEAKSRQAAHLVTATNTTDNFAVLDIEHWPMTAEGIPETVRKYNQVIDWVRDERPELKLGYYGVPPRRNYSDAIGTSTTRLATWYATNDSLAGMVPHVDVLFPSLYTFKNDIPAWVRYAKANIAEAKRLANGKPIYPYIWFKYHNSTPLKDQYIDPAFWRTQLETIRDTGVEGVVIWGSGGTAQWDDHAPWWTETKSFVSTLAKDTNSPVPFTQIETQVPLTSAEMQATLADLYRQLEVLQREVAKLKK